MRMQSTFCCSHSISNSVLLQAFSCPAFHCSILRVLRSGWVMMFLLLGLNSWVGFLLRFWWDGIVWGVVLWDRLGAVAPQSIINAALPPTSGRTYGRDCSWWQISWLYASCDLARHYRWYVFWLEFLKEGSCIL